MHSATEKNAKEQHQHIYFKIKIILEVDISLNAHQGHEAHQDQPMNVL